MKNFRECHFICLCLILLFVASHDFAGTIRFKDGTTISDAEIISISDGGIVVEKDKKKRRFPLNSITSYYKADIEGGAGAGGIPGEYADYKIKIFSVEMPETGEDKDGNTEFCELQYSISMANSKIKKIKVPYFYLYVLTARTSETGERKIYRYYYPDEAKPKGKGYDQAAIMTKVSGFDRPVWDSSETEATLRGGVSLSGGLSGRKVRFELKKIENKRILSYHLEIWGNNSIAAEKTWNDIGVKVAENWWERY